MKGQTSMVAIVLAVVMIVFIMIFIFSTTISHEIGKTAQAEYRNLYATNLLLSLLNTDTECGKFSDMIKARYFGGLQCTQEELAHKIGTHINDTLRATGNTDYKWLLETEPKNFVFTSMQWGYPEVTEEQGYWDARTVLSSGPNQLEVKLYIRTD